MVADELVAAVRQSAPSTAVLLHTGRADGQALGERLQVNLYAPKTAVLSPWSVPVWYGRSALHREAWPCSDAG